MFVSSSAALCLCVTSLTSNLWNARTLSRKEQHLSFVMSHSLRLMCSPPSISNVFRCVFVYLCICDTHTHTHT